MTAVCTSGRPGPNKTLPGSSVNAKECVCHCKRRTTKLFNYSIPELNDSYVWTHKGCVCNELVALKQRHQLDDGLRYVSKSNLSRHLRPFIKTVSPCSEDTVIAHSAGAKRKLLLSAKSSLEVYPIQPEDGAVKMFLKADKAHVFTDGNPDFGAPRCIQYRNKRYCLRLATYLHPVERELYKKLDISGTPIFAKGRNLVQRGQDLWAKFQHFRNPTIICMDHSKFDAHFGVELLRLEHKFYKSMFPKCDREELSRLLEMQINNKGSTKHGTKYRTRGTRCSGDQDRKSVV